MRPFTRRKRDRIYAEFTDAEARLLAGLSSQVVGLLNERHPGESQVAGQDPFDLMVGGFGPLKPPREPVLARLLPDAYRHDAEESAEFRGLTERNVTISKIHDAELIVDSLVACGLDMDAKEGPDVEVELNYVEALSWTRAVNDIRLALAVRLGIEDDQGLEHGEDSNAEEDQAMLEMYEWLGAVQESLVSCLS